VLITGISGFVGPHLAKSYIDEDNENQVYGLVRRRSDGDISRGLRDLGIEKQVKKIEGSIEDLSSLLMAFDEVQPDIVFHLAAQSFVHRSFVNPLETVEINCVGTANLLEAMRLKAGSQTKLIFAGSSEEYGFVAISKHQIEEFEKKHGNIFPPPQNIPELPIKETNPLRPMSPYAVTKVFGEHLTREYAHTFGLHNVVSRGFNHEGARRGSYFVTAMVARQIASIMADEIQAMNLGNISAFRDWTHIEDMVSAYRLLAEKGNRGDVYNVGSGRMNSVLGYVLLCLEAAGKHVTQLSTIDGEKRVMEPSEPVKISKYGKRWDSLRVEELMLEEKLSFDLKDKGLRVIAGENKIDIIFDSSKYRPTDVPYLLADFTKIEKLGYRPRHSLFDIAREQLNYYIDGRHRNFISPV